MGVGSLVASMAEDLSAMQETQVRSLDWKDPRVEEMATHPTILAWNTPWMKEHGGLESTGSRNSQTRQQLSNNKGQQFVSSATL